MRKLPMVGPGLEVEATLVVASGTVAAAGVLDGINRRWRLDWPARPAMMSMDKEVRP